jgi:hypothetical protein
MLSPLSWNEKNPIFLSFSVYTDPASSNGHGHRQNRSRLSIHTPICLGPDSEDTPGFTAPDHPWNHLYTPEKRSEMRNALSEGIRTARPATRMRTRSLDCDPGF